MAYANPIKLQRAKLWAKAQGKEGDEAVIKARYIELGGLMTEVEDEVSGEQDAPAPKRGKRAVKAEETE